MTWCNGALLRLGLIMQWFFSGSPQPQSTLKPIVADGERME